MRTSNVQRSTSNVQRARRAVHSLGSLSLDVGCWTLDVGRSTFLLLAFASHSTLAFAAGPWTIVDGSLEQVTASSFSIDDTTVRGAPGDAATKGFESPVGNFVSAARGAMTAVRAGDLVVHLAGGGRLVGTPVSSTDDAMTFHSATLGDRTVPLSAISRIDRKLDPPQETGGDAPQEDVATLANRDTIKGVVTAIDDENVTITVGEQPTTIALANLASLRFAAVADGAAGASVPSFAVTLSDGSVLRGADLKTIDDTTWSIVPAATGVAVAPLQLQTEQVVRVDHLAGPVVWLSSLTPTSVAYTPYLGESFPPVMDAPAGGGPGPIRAGDKAYEHGIGVHARTAITYALDGTRNAFRTRYAAEPGTTLTDAAVVVKLDDRDVHVGRVTPGFVSDVVYVELGDAKTITLEVDFGGGLHTQDRVNWLEPALVNAAPVVRGATTTQP